MPSPCETSSWSASFVLALYSRKRNCLWSFQNLPLYKIKTSAGYNSFCANRTVPVTLQIRTVYVLWPSLYLFPLPHFKRVCPSVGWLYSWFWEEWTFIFCLFSWTTLINFIFASLLSLSHKIYLKKDRWRGFFLCEKSMLGECLNSRIGGVYDFAWWWRRKMLKKVIQLRTVAFKLLWSLTCII